MLTIVFENTMGKGIGRIHKQIQKNWPYPSPNTNFILSQRPDPYIQTHRTSDSDATIDAHTL